MRVYHVIITLSLLWTDTTCQERADYSIQVQQDVTVQEGLCVTIPCRFTADNRSTFTNATGYWKISNSETVASNNKSVTGVKRNFHLTGNPDTGDCSLTITDARKEDGGKYHFRFEESPTSAVRYNYKLLTSMVTVRVTDLLPKISIPGKIMAGERVTLTCSLSVTCSGLSPAFQWSTGYQNIYNGSSVTFTASRSDNKKTITCKVTLPNVNPPAQTSIYLDVRYPPTITITGENKGKIIPKTETVKALEGDSLRLTCSVDSNPASSVIWKTGGADVTGRVIAQGRDLRLNIKPSDADTYYCIAWNEHGEIYKSVAINVQYAPRKPDVTISSSTGGQLEAGRSVITNEAGGLTLNCSADSNPAAVLTWIKVEDKGGDMDSNNIIGEGYMWSLVKVTSSEAGIYVCSARNKHGHNKTRIQIDRNPDPPSITITREVTERSTQIAEAVDVLEGESLRLNCSVESNQTANVTWMKGGDNVTRLETGQGLELHLTNISASDAGTYCCIAKNQYGEMNKTVTLNVQYPPRKPDVIIFTPEGDKHEGDRPVYISEGKSLTLNCSADGKPKALVRWIKEGIGAVSSQTLKEGRAQSLVNITPSGADTYRCLAWNKHGAIEKRTQIISIYGTTNYNTDPSTHDITSKIRDIMIGVICGIAIVLAALLMSKLCAKKRKGQSDPRQEPASTDDPSQLYMAVRKFPARSQSDDTGTQVDSRNVTAAQEELHYSTINFTTAPTRISSSQGDTDYAEIKLR